MSDNTFSSPTFFSRHRRLLAKRAAMALVCSWATFAFPAIAVDDIYQKAIDHPIRTDKDRSIDGSRRPLDFLTLTQVKPGMRVLDVAAGGGYTSQLLALVVGDSGHLTAQLTKPSTALDARLAAQPQKNIDVIVRSFEDVYPADFPQVDLVTLILNYHDIANLPVDRTKLNRSMFNALKSGGHLVIIDHAAKGGSGIEATSTLHRIDPAIVIQELAQVGFQLDAESAAWRNNADTHDIKSTQMETTSDRFAFRFVKP